MTPYLTSNDISNLDGIAHGFFSRLGGVSRGKFESLNCSPFSGDGSEEINENRNRVVQSLNGHCLFTNKQVHGNLVREVCADDKANEIVEADGMVTRCPGICLGALGADCAPIVFADTNAWVVGIAHAGWQGALNGITDSVLDQMLALGSAMDSIHCTIGPAIQLASYEVGNEFRKSFVAKSSAIAELFFSPHPETGNIHFDLPGYIESRLNARGVAIVECLDNDTYEEQEQFFSYRRTCHRGEKDYGRQISAICLVE